MMAQAIRRADSGIAVIPKQAALCSCAMAGRRLAHIVQYGDGAVNALLQNVCGGVNLAFGHGHQAYEVGEVGRRRR